MNDELELRGRLFEAFENASPELRSVMTTELEHQRWRARQEYRLQWAGLMSALVIVLAFLGVSAWLIEGGEAIAGTTLGTVDLVSLATVFIVRQRGGGGS